MAWSKPQKPVCLDFPRQFCVASHTSVTHSPKINVREIRPLGKIKQFGVLDNKSLIR